MIAGYGFFFLGAYGSLPDAAIWWCLRTGGGGVLTSRELSDIVFHLYNAQRAGGFILHVLHISGKRMKDTGVDGLSRGDHTEGMMVGNDPLSFLPFHQGADTRSRSRVGKWVHSWWRTSDQAQGSEQESDWGVSLWRKSTRTTCLSSRM